MQRRRSIAQALLLTLATLTIAACGSSGDVAEPTKAKESSGPVKATADEDDSTQIADDEAEVEASYRAWLTTYAKGDGESTCEASTEGYRKSLVADGKSQGMDFGDTCEAAIASTSALAKQYGTDLADQPINSVEVDGDSATLRVGDGDDREVVSMERDADDWLVSDSAEDKTGNRAQIDNWLRAWCSVTVGMTKAKAAEVMGDPTGEFDELESANPQVEWSQGAYSFTAFLDTGGVVKQLQSNYENLGTADRAKLTCPEVRK